MFGNTCYQIAGTQVLVNKAINELRDGVVSDLDTLDKLADSINNNPSFYSTMMFFLSQKVDTSSTLLWQHYKLTESTGDAMATGISDYDTINDPGIYGLNNGSTGGMSNAPSGFSSSAKAILKVDKYTGELSQTLINLSTKQVYIRTFSGSWQPWVLVIDSSLVGTNSGVAGLNSSGIVPDGQLPAWQRFKLSDDSGNAQTSGLTDYDTIISAGFYGLTDGSSTTMSYAPGAFLSPSNAILMVYTFSGKLFQQVVDCSGGAVYTRAYNGSTWSSW